VKINQATKGSNSNHEPLVDLIESIEHFLRRVNIYTRIPPTPATDEIVFKIILELLSTLALATKQLKHGRSSKSLFTRMLPYSAQCRNVVKFVKKGEKNVEVVLQRLDRLTQDEARNIVAEILEVVHGLVQNMRGIMDGEQTYSSCNPQSIDSPSTQTANHPLTVCGTPLVRFGGDSELVPCLTEQ
jgi:hypothetical protein